MSNVLHVSLYNTDPAASKELQSAICGLNFVRFVGEVTDADALASLLTNGGANLVFFHIDPNPDAVTEVIESLSTRYSEIALIAISSETDVRAVLGPMRAGCDQFVCKPIDHADLANAVARVAARRLARNTKSRCICVVAPNGGSGATSIACNLALEIGQLSDRDCALLDLGVQFGDAATNFDVEPKYSLYDLVGAHEQLDRSMIASTVMTLPCKIALLGRPEQVVPEEEFTPDLIHRVVELLGAIYENVVIDLPGQVNARTVAALCQADYIFVVSQLQVPSVRNARRYAEAVQHAGVPQDRIHFVLNRVDPRGGRITLQDVEETTKKPVFAAIPNDYQFVAKSIDFGRPVAALDSNNPVRSAIRKMASRILAPEAPGHLPAPDERKGFLGRLLAK